MPADPAIIGLAINGVTKFIDSKYGEKMLDTFGNAAKPSNQPRSDRRRRSGSSKKKYRRPPRPRKNREPVDVDALAADQLAQHEADKGRGEKDAVYKARLDEFRESKKRYAEVDVNGAKRERERRDSGLEEERRESADVNDDR